MGAFTPPGGHSKWGGAPSVSVPVSEGRAHHAAGTFQAIRRALLIAGASAAVVCAWFWWEPRFVTLMLVCAVAAAVVRSGFRRAPTPERAPTLHVVSWLPAVREGVLLAAAALLLAAEPWLATLVVSLGLATSTRPVAWVRAAVRNERALVRTRTPARPAARTRSRSSRADMQHPTADAAPGETDAAEAFACLLRCLDDSELCRAWSRSFAGVHHAASSSELARVAAVRQLYLDELSRRHPDGMRAWLGTGPRPSGDPTRFLSAPPPPPASPR